MNFSATKQKEALYKHLCKNIGYIGFEILGKIKHLIKFYIGNFLSKDAS